MDQVNEQKHILHSRPLPLTLTIQKKGHHPLKSEDKRWKETQVNAQNLFAFWASDFDLWYTDSKTIGFFCSKRASILWSSKAVVVKKLIYEWKPFQQSRPVTMTFNPKNNGIFCSIRAVIQNDMRQKDRIESVKTVSTRGETSSIRGERHHSYQSIQENNTFSLLIQNINAA